MRSAGGEKDKRHNARSKTPSTADHRFVEPQLALRGSSAAALQTYAFQWSKPSADHPDWRTRERIRQCESMHRFETSDVTDTSSFFLVGVTMQIAIAGNEGAIRRFRLISMAAYRNVPPGNANLFDFM